MPLLLWCSCKINRSLKATVHRFLLRYVVETLVAYNSVRALGNLITWKELVSDARCQDVENGPYY